jgi:hypothetical protein
MARINGNVLLEGTSGAIGKDVVYKVINGKTFVTKYPDRSRVIYTEQQLGYRQTFAKAAKFASEIVNDPVKKAAYPVEGRSSVYHAALKDYMTAHLKK